MRCKIEELCYPHFANKMSAINPCIMYVVVQYRAPPTLQTTFCTATTSTLMMYYVLHMHFLRHCLLLVQNDGQQKCGLQTQLTPTGESSTTTRTSKSCFQTVSFFSLLLSKALQSYKKSAHAHHFRILHIFYQFYAMVAKCSSSINISCFQIKIIFDNILVSISTCNHKYSQSNFPYAFNLKISSHLSS